MHEIHPEVPFDAIVFDCDSTLSQIEGINQLAEYNHVAHEVKHLTEKAMNETGITPDIYKKRLDLVRPTASQVKKIGQAYYSNLTPDADQVIMTLQQFHKSVYIISAGIQSAVEDFAAQLHIPASHVFAVPIYYDQQGHYCDYDHNAWMAMSQGKRNMIEKLKNTHHRLVFIGDGMNDVEAAPIADRFIGYGGAAFRENIAEKCDFYITSQSLTPLLPLCLTASEAAQLSPSQHTLYQSGMTAIHQGALLSKSKI